MLFSVFILSYKNVTHCDLNVQYACLCLIKLQSVAEISVSNSGTQNFTSEPDILYIHGWIHFQYV